MDATRRAKLGQSRKEGKSDVIPNTTGLFLSVVVAVICSSPTVAPEPQQSAATHPAAQAATRQPAVQPAIIADAAEHDFGQVRRGEKVEHRFKITNPGLAELTITAVKTNCGCTVTP